MEHAPYTSRPSFCTVLLKFSFINRRVLSSALYGRFQALVNDRPEAIVTYTLDRKQHLPVPQKHDVNSYMRPEGLGIYRMRYAMLCQQKLYNIKRGESLIMSTSTPNNTRFSKASAPSVLCLYYECCSLCRKAIIQDSCIGVSRPVTLPPSSKPLQCAGRSDV